MHFSAVCLKTNEPASRLANIGYKKSKSGDGRMNNSAILFCLSRFCQQQSQNWQGTIKQTQLFRKPAGRARIRQVDEHPTPISHNWPIHNNPIIAFVNLTCYTSIAFDAKYNKLSLLRTFLQPRPFEKQEIFNLPMFVTDCIHTKRMLLACN